MEILSSVHRISIKEIFKAHWPNYLATHQDSIPDYVSATIEKMLSCRDSEKLGYHKYACPEYPDQYVVIPHSCKSRFCNSCGKVLTDKWVKKINSLFPFKMLHKRYQFLLVKHLKESVTHYLRKHPEEGGELKVFREKKSLP